MTTQTASPELADMVRNALAQVSPGRQAQFAGCLADLTPARARAILRQLNCTETDSAPRDIAETPRKASTGSTASTYRSDDASEKQARYAADLLRTRVSPGERVIGTVKTAAEALALFAASGKMSRKLARDVIDMYADRPRIQVAPVAPRPAQAAAVAPVAPLVPGIYQVGDDVYKVQQSKQSGRLYAQKLVDGRFDYDAGWGAMKFIRAEHLMTTEQAKAFGMRFGMCVNGHPLSDRTSRYFGYGEKCAGNNGWLYDKKLVPADFE